ncbi:hypothetical protein [Chitinimonas naiadis]
MHFSDADTRHLHLLLADAASGTPRQWWHLEIAARRNKAAPSGKARLLGGLLRLFGPGWLAPQLDRLGLQGMVPYRLSFPAWHLKRAEDAALAAICLHGTLLGLGSLNASRELLLILLAVLGGIGAACLSGRQAWQLRQQTLDAQAQTAESLTPSESALGLTGLFTAAGYPYPAALAAAERLANQPGSIGKAELEMLGLSAPANGEVIRLAGYSLLAWLLGVTAIGWPCWLTSANWQFVPAVLGVYLVHFVSAAQSTRYHWRRPSQHALAGLACFAAGLLIHRL